MLFARDIFQMYSKYAMYRGWQFDIISYDEADKGLCACAQSTVSVVSRIILSTRSSEACITGDHFFCVFFFCFFLCHQTFMNCGIAW